MSPLAPDDRLRQHRTAKQQANQLARETRDLHLLQIDNYYLPEIDRLERERLAEMRDCWNRFLARRAEINQEFAED